MNSADDHVNGVLANEQATGGVRAFPSDFYTAILSRAARNRKPDASEYLYDLQRLLSKLTYDSRLPFLVRAFLPLEHCPGIISMLAGQPNTSTFPITSLHFTARDPTSPSGEDLKIELSPSDLAAALQYGATAGVTELREWLQGLQQISHGRKKGEGWRLSIGAGSQDLLNKVMLYGDLPRSSVRINMSAL